MVEGLTVGQIRLQYLDMANKAYSANDFGSAQAYIDDFLVTIKDETDAAKEITKKFDEVEQKKQVALDQLIKETEIQENFQQSENRYYGNNSVLIQALKDKMNACWFVAQDKGLLHE
jgi:cell division septum initiation protein DivIVA